MKFLLTAAAIALFAIQGYSQECKSFIPSQSGTSLEMTSYNAKGKKNGKTVSTYNDIVKYATGMQATINAVMYDKNDDEIATAEFDAKCKGNSFFIDMASFISADQMTSIPDMDISVDGDYLVVPSDLQVGATLPDGHMELSSESAVGLMNFTFDITNRKVIAHENVTTPAGTFNAIKISYDFNSKVTILNIKGTGVEWWVEDLGIVRTESYNKKGKLTGTTELTAKN